MPEYITASGIEGIGKVSWGNHICHFYRSRQELIESIVPFFAAGLRNNERCMLGTGMPFYAEDVRSELAKLVPDIDACLRKEQISIFDHHEWYANNGANNPIADLLQVEEKALKDGYKGLRCAGNISWITRKDWKAFSNYESGVNRVLPNRRILALCSYEVTKCEGPEVFEAMRNHHFTIAKQDDCWGLFETTRKS